LWFDNNVEEAINYYVSVFNGNPNKKNDSKVISIKRYPEGPLEGPMKGFEGKVLTGVFELEGHQFMALDGGPIFKFNESMSLLVDCQDQQEIDYFWDTFTKDGGQESQCGWLKDKYGFSWQIVPDMGKFMGGNSEKSKKAMSALLKMKKIIIADLEKAQQE
ncbi:MAG TPA: VOC family protein, partial [Verrucomicrobiae bacterium]|nr:VOC family protein [Verrucomicrobiae bacterium]